MRKQQGKILIWPVYFDLSKTRKEGRKVPKSLAVGDPKISELQKASVLLGLEIKVNIDGAHPALPWRRTGKALIQKNSTKKKTLISLAEKLAEIRREID